MNEIGQKIKQAREEKGIEIKEVQQATKIRSKYLRAIENGNFEIVPQEVFLKGFIRVYANYVGLDGEKILAEYNQLQSSPKDKSEDKDKQAPKEDSIIENLLKIIHKKVQMNWKQGVVAIVVLVSIISIGLFLYRSGSVVKVFEAAQNVGKESVQKEKLVLEEKENEVEDNQLSTKEANNDNKRNKEDVQHKLNFTIKALESSWVRVFIDGKVVFEKILNPGEKKSWDVEEKLKLLTANAAGIRVISKGKVYGPFGQEGEVVEKEFNLN